MANPHAYAKDSAAFSAAVEELRNERVELSPGNIEERYNEIIKRKDKPSANKEKLEEVREANIEKTKKATKKTKK